MEIEITSLIASPHFTPSQLSNSIANLGADAGPLTWNASKTAARAIVPPLLDTEKKKTAFRSFACESGGWTKGEIAEWDETELNALFLQWVAGDIRETFGDADFAEWDWTEAEKEANAGKVPGRLFKTDDGRVFFYIGN